MKRNITPRHIDAIESAIDTGNVTQVLYAIRDICNGKADHVAINWRDSVLARHWADLATIADKAADKAWTKEKVLK
jgi:hypothetical protein